MPRLGSRRSGWRLSLVVLMVSVMLLATACSSPGPATAGPVKTVNPPGTPRRSPAPVADRSGGPSADIGAEARAHFDAAFLAQVSPARSTRACRQPRACSCLDPGQ